MCGECQSTQWDFIASAGEGTVYSYVVMHYPQVPGYDYPLVVAVVDLGEGTHFVSNIIDCDPDRVEIGMAVRADFLPTEEDKGVPRFVPA